MFKEVLNYLPTKCSAEQIDKKVENYYDSIEEKQFAIYENNLEQKLREGFENTCEKKVITYEKCSNSWVLNIFSRCKSMLDFKKDRK